MVQFEEIVLENIAVSRGALPYQTYWANIYIGLKWSRTESLFPIDVVHSTCQNYVNDVSYCVSVTPTTFIYKNGNEPGAIVGLINYPRFPSSRASILHKAKNLTKELMNKLYQMRVTIVMPDQTIMLNNEEEAKLYVESK